MTLPIPWRVFAAPLFLSPLLLAGAAPCSRAAVARSGTPAHARPWPFRPAPEGLASAIRSLHQNPVMQTIPLRDPGRSAVESLAHLEEGNPDDMRVLGATGLDATFARGLSVTLARAAAAEAGTDEIGKIAAVAVLLKAAETLAAARDAGEEAAREEVQARLRSITEAVAGGEMSAEELERHEREIGPFLSLGGETNMAAVRIVDLNIQAARDTSMAKAREYAQALLAGLPGAAAQAAPSGAGVTAADRVGEHPTPKRMGLRPAAKAGTDEPIEMLRTQMGQLEEIKNRLSGRAAYLRNRAAGSTANDPGQTDSLAASRVQDAVKDCVDLFKTLLRDLENIAQRRETAEARAADGSLSKEDADVLREAEKSIHARAQAIVPALGKDPDTQLLVDAARRIDDLLTSTLRILLWTDRLGLAGTPKNSTPAQMDLKATQAPAADASASERLQPWWVERAEAEPLSQEALDAERAHFEEHKARLAIQDLTRQLKAPGMSQAERTRLEGEIKAKEGQAVAFSMRTTSLLLRHYRIFLPSRQHPEARRLDSTAGELIEKLEDPALTIEERLQAQARGKEVIAEADHFLSRRTIPTKP